MTDPPIVDQRLQRLEHAVVALADLVAGLVGPEPVPGEEPLPPALEGVHDALGVIAAEAQPDGPPLEWGL